MNANVYEWVETGKPMTGTPTVTQIIMFRNITGLGLRESKDVIDGFNQGGYRYLVLPTEFCNGSGGPDAGRSGHWHLVGRMIEKLEMHDDEYLPPIYARELEGADAHAKALASELKEYQQVASKLYGIIREMYDMTGYDLNVSALKDLADELARDHSVIPKDVNRSVTYKF